MQIKIFRLLAIVILAWIIFKHKYVLIGYWAVLVGVLEWLNTRPRHKDNKHQFNLWFLLYLLFITVIRTTNYILPKKIVYIINTIEHLFFALAVSYMLWLILQLSQRFRQLTLGVALLLIAILFNAVGILNEVYQCLAKARPPFYFIHDFGSLLDIAVNIGGSFIFSVLLWLKYPNNSLKNVA